MLLTEGSLDSMLGLQAQAGFEIRIPGMGFDRFQLAAARHLEGSLLQGAHFPALFRGLLPGSSHSTVPASMKGMRSTRAWTT